MKELRSRRDPYTLKRTSPYEGPYRKPSTLLPDIIFVVVVFSALAAILFYSLSA